MECVIEAKHVNKSYGEKIVLKDINLQIPSGKIIGLIGPNGAGKTTFLKGILGLSPVDGELRVLGFDPHKERVKLLEQVSFIADTAILPRWINVSELISYTEAVHPRFSREKCMSFLNKTNITLKDKVKNLSKGMVTQLHLALIMAIDSKLLVLDEPTLGLDILYRKQFYESLLNDFYDAEKTILITTHQVEEIESVLTDLLFMNDGKIVLNETMDSVAESFVELHIDSPQKEAALRHNPIHMRSILGGYSFMYEQADRDQLSKLGRLINPNLADVFVAKIQPSLSV